MGNISKIHSQNIYSLKQAINITALRESMNQGDNMLTLIEDLAKDTKTISHPHKGRKVDISV